MSVLCEEVVMILAIWGLIRLHEDRGLATGERHRVIGGRSIQGATNPFRENYRCKKSTHKLIRPTQHGDAGHQFYPQLQVGTFGPKESGKGAEETQGQAERPKRPISYKAMLAQFYSMVYLSSTI